MNISNQLPRTTQVFIIIAIMAATLMQTLDMTIINVALSSMQGSLAAKPDEITWVLTSFLVSSAIFMPLTGYFADTLGQKKYLLISIVGFVISSALCGISTNITQIVIFRLLQGTAGAALIPLSQTIMSDIFPEQDRGKAMAIWGIGVMVGPILGPTLGGFITEISTWRWNFYINVPVGIVSLILTWQYLPDTIKTERSMDWVGLILISTSIAALQYFLDRGNQDDWFNSTGICIAAFLTITGFLGFLLMALMKNQQKTVFNLHIFLDRNFSLASILLAMFGLGLFGAMIILPLMLENLFNYPTLTTGLVMAPRGIAAMISMILMGRLIKTTDPRYLIAVGIILSSFGMYLGTYYNLNLSKEWIIGPIFIQGLGLGMIFVPLSTLAFATLPDNLRQEASGLFNLLRTIGSSIGISIVANLLSRGIQIKWNQFGGFVNLYNPNFLKYIQIFSEHKIPDLLGKSIIMKIIVNNAQMLSYVNIHAFITYSFLIMLPLILLFKKPQIITNPASVTE